MKTTRSSDGTTIAYDTAGSGPRLVLVDGALCTRRIGPGKGLARLLAEHFTVINYDRRGRGDSGDAVEYAIEREVEDLEAVIETAGGNAFVFGQSSGAVLALHAAARLPQITGLAVYEAPFIVDDTRAPTGPEYHEKVTELLARGKRGPRGAPVPRTGRPAGGPRRRDAAHAVMAKAQGRRAHPAIRLTHHRRTPTRPAPFTRPVGSCPATHAVLCGGDSDAWMRNAMQALADTLPTRHTACWTARRTTCDPRSSRPS